MIPVTLFKKYLSWDGDFACWTTVFTTLRTGVRDHHQGENIRTRRGQGPQGVQSTDFPGGETEAGEVRGPSTGHRARQEQS